VNTAAHDLAIDDRLIYEGSAYVVCGFTPMGVEPARIYLRKASKKWRSAGEVVSVPADAVCPTERARDVA
jgi:hypothetical protein